MGPAKFLTIAGATALLTTAASAADFPQAMPPAMPPIMRAPPPDVGGFYLRGDVGIGNQKFGSFDHIQTNAATAGPWPASWRIEQKDIKDTFLVGIGVGYALNSWLRFDVTGEYRADVKFKAVGSYINFPNPASLTPLASDFYDGDHSAWVFLANAYVDLGTWWCLTPFVGVGVGGVYHRTAALSDIGLNTNGAGLSAWGVANADYDKWSFAWAVHAGLGYEVTRNFKVELAYRYLNMGTAQTSEILCGATGCGSGSGPRAYYQLKNMDSHDIKLGVRWMLSAPEPVVQPIYAPPPLMRRG